MDRHIKKNDKKRSNIVKNGPNPLIPQSPNPPDTTKYGPVFCKQRKKTFFVGVNKIVCLRGLLLLKIFLQGKKNRNCYAMFL